MDMLKLLLVYLFKNKNTMWSSGIQILVCTQIPGALAETQIPGCHSESF